ncbi:2-(1,2-epoxy-1,2-dihydrophenyl)acetyl-CoA isomerase [Halomonas daqingensis]|uniref:2-(1,2-epoxy-1,2-dihydrophenyl)acetyl-CoA isomerase n=1 Tax=Billgrantia desiderata TaxID=52021 RepID=A0ABS9B435_9GAMM|nr:2-(1,2-epoxy-1,2-dihydrophenyl)acetyl-CoA isomerase PaaG [Halomonas desiderata]MCE8042379.1 2-(1,2-epoxy-1,2-dihydrophenyl)acetyl-CoA isomerase [Halomonas desiderata]MCE8046954.1 2-(1,2-epoxy-1,2-dihydrophenyl)acetyl-CoA isomerase [Halomonas desiderata]
MSYQCIEFSIKEGVATLTLNRPETLNSFNVKMHEEVWEALDRLMRDDKVRCLLITGRGRGFSAGQDLSERRPGPNGEAPDLGQSLEVYYNPLVRRLRSLPMPVICAVNGVAAGAGANLALNCDIVLAARSASFIQAFCKLGLVPDSGGTWLLPRLVGRARARGLALLGDRINAEQAEAWGLIWKVVDDEHLMQEAMALSRHLSTQPTQGLAYIKQALEAAEGNDMDAQLDLERDLQRAAGRSEDYREGVAAFKEKRTPSFTGK